MFCKKCGSEVGEGAKFCRKCGAPVGSGAGSSNGTHINNSEYSDNNPVKKPQKTFGKRIIRLAAGAVLLMFVLAIGILLALDYVDIIDAEMVHSFLNKPQAIETTPELETTGNPGDTQHAEPERVDADEYYGSISTIVSEIIVTESEVVQSEADAISCFEDRGFSDFAVSFEYSLEGEYGGEIEADEASSTKHPIYQTYYVSSNDELWTVVLINNSVMAYPVSYHMQAEYGTTIIVSESKMITTYDSQKNKFYEIVPHESEAKVIVIEEINAEALDALTVEVIESVWKD